MTIWGWKEGHRRRRQSNKNIKLNKQEIQRRRKTTRKHILAHKMVSTNDTNIAYFFGFIGVASALVFANLGAAYGTAKSGVGITSMGVLKPDLIMKSIIPVVMAGILGIYGMIVAVILVQKIPKDAYTNY